MLEIDLQTSKTNERRIGVEWRISDPTGRQADRPSSPALQLPFFVDGISIPGLRKLSGTLLDSLAYYRYIRD